MNHLSHETTPNTVRPRVLISRCVSFEHCRWNGDIISSRYVESLKKYIDFITVCPECDIGLGTPRKPLRLVMVNNSIRMIQHESALDVTKKIYAYTGEVIQKLEAIDGMLLKERSPSCGTTNVKIYSGTSKKAPLQSKGSGLFGTALTNAMPWLPHTSEGHLYNFALREHFYTQLFTLSRFRILQENPSLNELIAFHSHHKFILMSYHQTIMRQLGTIVANHEKKEITTLYNEYFMLLCRVLARPPRIHSPINVLMHALGYFSDTISSGEKKYFLTQLDLYREKKIPLSVCNAVIMSWIVRFDVDYLATQYFFNPYPEALIELSDSGK